MASASKGKGSVDPGSWCKHMRPEWRKYFNKRVRTDGKKQIKKETE